MKKVNDSHNLRLDLSRFTDDAQSLTNGAPKMGINEVEQSQEWIQHLRKIFRAELPQHSRKPKLTNYPAVVINGIDENEVIETKSQEKVVEEQEEEEDDDSLEISFLMPKPDPQKKIRQDLYEQFGEEMKEEMIEEEDSNKEESSSEEDSIPSPTSSPQARLKLQLMPELVIKRYKDEFEEEYQQIANSQTQNPSLDVVEMNVFERIKIFDDFNGVRKFYKQLWLAQSNASALCGKIASNKIFENISLLVILFNCVILALDDPTTQTDDEQRVTIEFILLVLYTVEMGFKVGSMGFVYNQGAYLRDLWNILDFVIIFTGYLPYIVSTGTVNLNGVRSLRVLRPLRTISTIKALKQILNTLFSSLSLMKDALFILLFFYLVFAIAGQQLFTGALKKRCYFFETGILYHPDNNYSSPTNTLCSSDDDCTAYGNPNVICGKGMESPNYDIENFDTFGWSLLNVYVVVAQEGWTITMAHTQQAFAYISFVYFLACVLVGSLFLENLLMAIIQIKYQENESLLKKRPRAIIDIKSYNLEDFKKWGVYKSNKVLYKEREENFLKRLSTFGEIVQLLKRTGSIRKLFQSDKNEKPVNYQIEVSAPQEIQLEELPEENQPGVVVTEKSSRLDMGTQNKLVNQGEDVENDNQSEQSRGGNQLRVPLPRATYNSKKGTFTPSIYDNFENGDMYGSAFPQFSRNNIPKHSIKIKDFQQLSYTQNVFLPRIHPIRIRGINAKNQNLGSFAVRNRHLGHQQAQIHQNTLKIPSLRIRSGIQEKMIRQATSFILSPSEQNSFNNGNNIFNFSPEQISRAGSANKKGQKSLFSSEIQDDHPIKEQQLMPPPPQQMLTQSVISKFKRNASRQGTIRRSRLFKRVDSEMGDDTTPQSEEIEDEEIDDFFEKIEKIEVENQKVLQIMQGNFTNQENEGQGKDDKEELTSIQALRKQKPIFKKQFLDEQKEQVILLNNKKLSQNKDQTPIASINWYQQFQLNQQKQNNTLNVNLPYDRGVSPFLIRQATSRMQSGRDIQETPQKKQTFFFKQYESEYVENDSDEEKLQVLMKLPSIDKKIPPTGSDLIQDEDFYEYTITRKDNKEKFAKTAKELKEIKKTEKEKKKKEKKEQKKKEEDDAKKDKKNHMINQVFSKDEGELYRRLFENKYLVARVLFKQPDDYIKDILPRENLLKKQKRKQNMLERIKKIKYHIIYSAEKRIQLRSVLLLEQQKKQERAKLIHVRKSETVKQLLLQQNKIHIEQPVIDQISKRRSTMLAPLNLFIKRIAQSQANHDPKIDKKNDIEVQIKEPSIDDGIIDSSKKDLMSKSRGGEKENQSESISLKQLSENKQDQGDATSIRMTNKDSKQSQEISPFSKNNNQMTTSNSKEPHIKSILKLKTLPGINSQIDLDEIPQPVYDNQSLGAASTFYAANTLQMEVRAHRKAMKNIGDKLIFEWDAIKARELFFPSEQEIQTKSDIDNEAEQVLGENLSLYNSILDESRSNLSFGSQSSRNSANTSPRNSDSEYSKSQRESDNLSVESGNSFNSRRSSISAKSDELRSMTTAAERKHNRKEQDSQKQAKQQNSKTQTADASKKKDNIPDNLKPIDSNGNQISAEEYLKQPLEKEYSKIVKAQLSNYLHKGSLMIKQLWSGDEILPIQKMKKSPKSMIVLLKSLNYTDSDQNLNEGGIYGIVQAFRRTIKHIIQLSLYENLIMLCVVLNTVVLALDGSISSEDTLDLFNLIFTYIFAADLVLKLTGLGFSEYVSDKMNIFDAAIVALSIFDMIFLSSGSSGGSSFSAFRSVRILRVFRVLRVTRLLRQLMFMKVLISVISSIFEKLMYILMLLLLYIFIYTLIGMQIYGGKFQSVSRTNRMVFDSFLEASLTVFDLLTVENWNIILQVALRTDVSSGITAVYLISCIFIGNFIIMNLVLATMIGAFNSSTFDRDRSDMSSNLEIVEDLDLSKQGISSQFSSSANTSMTHITSLSITKRQHNSIASSLRKPSIYSRNHIKSVSSFGQRSFGKGSQIGSEAGEKSQQDISFSQKQKADKNKSDSSKSDSEKEEKEGQSSGSEYDNNDDHSSNSSASEISQGDEQQKDQEGSKIKNQKSDLSKSRNMFQPKQSKDSENKFIFFDEIECQRSLYLFSFDSVLRKNCYYISKQQYFENIILIGIALNSIKLVSDTYVPGDDLTIQTSIKEYLDIFFSIFFAFESLIKIISYGFILDDNSYLRDSWSQLDFFVVVTSIIDVAYTGVDLKAVKILRLLRTLRPLRLLHHNKSMKLIVTTLIESITGILNMLLVLFLVWLMFAILGISLMKGRMYYCNFPNNNISYNLYSYNSNDCLAVGGQWQVYDMNFENVQQSLLTLFVYSTFENWPNYSFNFFDGTTDGPVYGGNAFFAIYVCIFILIGSFFSIDLFGAVLSFHYDIAQRKAKNKYLSDEQTQWIELQRLILKSQPDFTSIQQPTNKFRLKVWLIAESTKLEIFIMICIIGNVLSMALTYETSPTSYDTVLSYINLVFSIIFICESILKMIAYGIDGYFYKTSNKFDFFVVSVSIVDIIFSYSGKSIIKFISAGPQIARIFRVFRVTRLLRLVKQFEGLQKLLQTLIFAMPSLLNVTGLLMLIYFIFSILACFLFSSIESGNSLDSFQNFSTFHRSFLLLFRISTGEDWNIVMFDVIRSTNGWSALFFVIFIVVQQYIMMNLFVLIIIEQFEQNYINSDNPLNDFKYSEEDFKKQWVLFSRDNLGVKIHERFITDFYFATLRPLGFNYRNKEKEFVDQVKIMNQDVNDADLEVICAKFRRKQKQLAEKDIMQMSIKCDFDGFIYFNELLYYFFKHSLYKSVFERTERARNQNELEKCIKSDIILAKQEKMTLRRLKHIKKKQAVLTHQKFSSGRQKEVNPMVRRLFVGMCFQSWLKYGQNTQNKLNNAKDVEDISSETDSDELQDDEIDLQGLQDIDKFYNNKEEENIIQVRSGLQRKNIIPREHTIHLRNLPTIQEGSSRESQQISEFNSENSEIKQRNKRRKETSALFFNGKFIDIPDVTEVYQNYFDENRSNFFKQKVYSQADALNQEEQPEIEVKTEIEPPVPPLLPISNQPLPSPSIFKVNHQRQPIQQKSFFPSINIQTDFENSQLEKERQQQKPYQAIKLTTQKSTDVSRIIISPKRNRLQTQLSNNIEKDIHNPNNDKKRDTILVANSNLQTPNHKETQDKFFNRRNSKLNKIPFLQLDGIMIPPNPPPSNI